MTTTSVAEGLTKAIRKYSTDPMNIGAGKMRFHAFEEDTDIVLDHLTNRTYLPFLGFSRITLNHIQVQPFLLDTVNNMVSIRFYLIPIVVGDDSQDVIDLRE